MIMQKKQFLLASFLRDRPRNGVNPINPNCAQQSNNVSQLIICQQLCNKAALCCFLPYNHSVTIIFIYICILIVCSIYLLVCNGENGTFATDTPPPTGLEQDFIALVACPAPSRRNRPVPCLATLSSSPSHLPLTTSSAVSLAPLLLWAYGHQWAS